MAEFLKNGKNVEVKAIYSKGKVGQIVIYGERVDWGVNPDPIKYPLSQYHYPSIFTIEEKKEGEDGYYVLRDSNGKCFKIQDKYYGASSGHLFDA